MERRLAVPLALLLALPVACGPNDDAADVPADTFDGHVPDAPDDGPVEALAPGLLRVVFFDVGTGDSILVQAPNGRTLLVDLGLPQVYIDGHEPDTAQYVTRRIEELTGRRAVDYFLASHYHTDHVGSFRSGGQPSSGIGWAVEYGGLAVGTFLDRGRNPAGDSPTQTDYLRWAENRTSRRVIDRPGSDWVDLGPDVVVEVLAVAGAGIAPAGSDENGFSLPVRVTFGDFELALAGDLTGDCDSDLFDVETAVAPLMGTVEVYKVNHHGSQNSSNLTWLAALRPLVAVFPVGESRFAYPHARVVTALGTFADSYRTSEGELILESPDGRTFTIGGRTYTARSDATEATLEPPSFGVDEKSDALCRNGRDDDRDGYTDCSDWSCSRCPGLTACR